MIEYICYGLSDVQMNDAIRPSLEECKPVVATDEALD